MPMADFKKGRCQWPLGPADGACISQSHEGEPVFYARFSGFVYFAPPFLSLRCHFLTLWIDTIPLGFPDPSQGNICLLFGLLLVLQP